MKMGHASGGVCVGAAKIRVPKPALALLAVAGCLAAAPLAPVAHAECTSAWSDQFATPGFGGLIEDAVYWDDGTGESLYVCGSFLSIGGLFTTTPRVAKWNGSAFEGVVNSTAQLNLLRSGFTKLHKMIVFDPDGPGPQTSRLVATGNALSSQCVVQYDGTTWTTMTGITGEGFDLEVFNGELYVSGKNPLGGIAKWTGTTWTRVGGATSNGSGEHMAVCDADGDGLDELYLSGTFQLFGNPQVFANHLAKWDGTTWTAVDGFLDTGGLTDPTFIDTVDLGDGPSLLVGNARYDGVGDDRVAIARLHNGTWSTLLGNVRLNLLYGQAYCAAMFQGQLHVGGYLSTDTVSIPTYPNGVPMVIRRDAQGNWEPIAMNTAVDGVVNEFGRRVWLLKEVDFDGPGPGGNKLLMSGDYNAIIGGLYCPYNALWNGTSTEIPHIGSGSLGISTANSLNAPPSTAQELDIDGPGPIPSRFYIAGDMQYLDGQVLQCSVVTFDGTGYTQLPPGPRYAEDLVVYDDGTGPALVVSTWYPGEGYNNPVTKFNSATNTWESMGSLGGNDLETAVIDGQSVLLAAGEFYETGNPGASGLLSTPKGVARWDGTSWQAMDEGLPSGYVSKFSHFAKVNGVVYLYVSEGISGNIFKVFRWDAGQWNELPVNHNATSSRITAGIASLNFGGSESLYLFGSFTALNGATIERLARWTGTDWEAVGGGIQASGTVNDGVLVTALGTHDFGSGVELVAMIRSVGSTVYTAGGTVVSGGARYNGTSWAQITGLEGTSGARFVASSSNPAWGGLYIGGNSNPSNNGLPVQSGGIARLITTCTCPADFNNSGNVSVQDIFDFLGAWFAGNASADVNDSGTVTVQDIFDFLGLWFSGC